MRVRRRIIMILLIFFCFLLQSTLFQSTFAVADVAPNLMVILTVSFGLMRGKREGMFVGFLGVILSDLFFGSALGFTALLYVIIGGTSLAVYPAAGLIDYFNGKYLVVINKSPTPRDRQADLLISEPIGEVLGGLHV